MRTKWYQWGFWGIFCGLALLCAVTIVQKLPLLSPASGETSPTLVLDAGHGGFDGGAVGAGGTEEQQINLSIAQRVHALAGFFGVSSTLTRPDENALDYVPGRTVRENKVADIKARARITEQQPNPIFISIHLNKFEQAQYHGAQVFYSPNHAGSSVLAALLQDTLIRGCDPQNTRVPKQAERSIYLMRQLHCPAVVVECGFLSNPHEEVLLGQETYQKRLATCILVGYLRYQAPNSL